MSSTEAVLLERINSTVSRIDGKTVELQNSINSKLGFIPGPVQSSIRQMLPLQKAALEKIKTTITDGLATALGQVHLGILMFWSGLGGALTALAIGIVGALASSSTILGMPAAPFIAAGAAVTASLSLIVGCETLKACCTSANTTLRQKFDDTGFFRGHWPPAGTA